MRNPLGDVVGKVDALALGLRPEDRDPRFEVGLIDLGDEALKETTSESLLKSREVAR